MDPSFLRIVAEVHWAIKIKLKAMHWKNGTIEAGRLFHSEIAAFQVVPFEAKQSKATKTIRDMQLDWLKIGIISENLQMKKMCFNKVHIHALARLIKNNNNEQKMKAEKKITTTRVLCAFKKMLLLLNSTIQLGAKSVHSKRIYLLKQTVCRSLRRTRALSYKNHLLLCLQLKMRMTCMLSSFVRIFSLFSLARNCFYLFFLEWILQHWHWLSANA